MNPIYVPYDMDEDRKNQLIVKKTVIFSDVMQCITDLKGKADSYFTNLNRQMIANIAILVMLTVPALKQRHASPADLQLLLNNFDLFGEYVDKLKEIDRKANRYTFIIQYVRQDILGFGRTKMEDQSRGTRNIINEFLLMPANKEVFCAQNIVDFDRAPANGEIIVCNYKLSAAGDSDAVAFGFFFLLSMNNAVLSRPGTEKHALRSKFHLTPSEYREKKLPFPLFVQYPVTHYCALLKHKEESIMSNESNLCMVTAVKSCCRYRSAALDFDKPLPEQYKVAELEACTMLYFQSEPYENEEDFCKAIEGVYAAVGKYKPELYGYRLAYDMAPSFNVGADTSTGAKIAVPAVTV